MCIRDSDWFVHRRQGEWEEDGEIRKHEWLELVCPDCQAREAVAFEAELWKPHLIAHKDRVEYRGEEMGGVLLRLFEHVTRHRRVPLSEKVRKEIAHERQCRCGLCDDKVDNFEIHHVKPVAEGGTNARENLTLLCRPCHRSHTDQQENKGNHGDLCTVLSPENMAIFEGPKPKQGA